MSKAKEYLGDGLYAELQDSGNIIVTSEDGIQVLNEVYFEPVILAQLIRFAKNAWGEEVLKGNL